MFSKLCFNCFHCNNSCMVSKKELKSCCKNIVNKSDEKISIDFTSNNIISKLLKSDSKYIFYLFFYQNKLFKKLLCNNCYNTVDILDVKYMYDENQQNMAYDDSQYAFRMMGILFFPSIVTI